MSRRRLLTALALLPAVAAVTSPASLFELPTANHALFQPAGGEQFLVGTVGKPWTSGGFGCVRSDGWQFHEGLDIRCLQRDAHSEPTDPVLATADGTVVYASSRPALSNYGNYLVLRHRVAGLEIYSLYAHLSALHVRVGQSVRAGEVIATMGHTANTHEGISKDRAHLHFELDLLANPRFAAWFAKSSPGERNDHGAYNGQNLLGFDPRRVLLWQQQLGDKFNFVQCLTSEAELCRVLVRAPNLAWALRYPMLGRRNPLAEKEGVAGYELALNYSGLPFEFTPRAASEFRTPAKIRLLSVNAAEQKKNPCGRLVSDRSGAWKLTSKGERLLDLLTY